MREAPLITIVFNLLAIAIKLLTWALLLSALISTLLSLNVLDSRNRFVWSVADFLYKVTDPILRPVRRMMPRTGSFDLSYLVALLLLQAVLAPLLDRLYSAIETGSVQPLVF